MTSDRASDGDDERGLRPEDYAELVEAALREDHAREDPVSALLPAQDRRATAEVVVKAAGVVCGLEVAEAVLRRLDPQVQVERRARDGDVVGAGQVVLTATGSARALLRAERSALNFVGHLSGVATKTARLVERALSGRAGIYDTRKTTPGWRALEKYAVRCGGGHNHRMHLADAAMVKENHLQAAYGHTGPEAVGAAVRTLRAHLPAGARFYVEVEDAAELEAVLEAAGTDAGRMVAMLDDFDLGAIRAAVRRVQALEGPRPLLEVTGGVDEENVEALAASGVARISCGALTHSAPALDVALRLRADPDRP